MDKFTPRLHALWLCACAVLAVAGCATPVATSETNELSFDQAVNAATDGLVSQTQNLPAFLAKVEAKILKRGVVTDPMLDAGSGQQTGVTKLLEQRVTERMRTNYTQFDILPFQSANLSKAQYLLTGTITRVQGGKTSNVFRINLALTDLKTGNVVAQSSARARDEGLDTNPTPYYRDSPILVKDKVVDGYIRTCETPPGKPADRAYFERVATATLINEATTAYNSDRYQDALGLYNNALSTPAGEQLRVLNGVYLTNWKLGKTAEAEQAFGKVVAFGIANNTLGVKFLFNPGSTDFWSDPKVSGPYTLWLRQIARQAAAAKVCVNVVGHTSKTGSEQANDRLSLNRATYIKQRLESEAPDLASRTKANGMGFRENIVGTGTDDARDALDRRVEFKISGC
jgi:outer membrane protein OmpA-like peptidoglycan-associated protein